MFGSRTSRSSGRYNSTFRFPKDMAAQIHKTLFGAPPTPTASLTGNMRCEHITLHATHLWGVPPTSQSTGRRVNGVLALPQPLHQTMGLKSLIKSRKNKLMALACTQLRETLLQHAPPIGNPHCSPLQQYIEATLPDLYRKKLNTPAPYMRTCSQIPTLPLLRARCQNLIHLRSNLYDKTDTALPYRGISCPALQPHSPARPGPSSHPHTSPSG